MSWTAPRTWVVGEVLTAGLLNAHVRDNLLETAPAVATAVGLPYADAANSLALLAAVGNGGKYIRFNAGATAIEAADAGGGMNWAIEQTGDPAFPHNGDTTTDVISSCTGIINHSAGGSPPAGAAPGASVSRARPNVKSG